MATSTFLLERITATKALIAAYENALLVLGGDNAPQSYTIDTGQTRTTVTRADIPDMNKMLDSLYNRCATLEARAYGTGVVMGRPMF